MDNTVYCAREMERESRDSVVARTLVKLTFVCMDNSSLMWTNWNLDDKHHPGVDSSNPSGMFQSL